MNKLFTAYTLAFAENMNEIFAISMIVLGLSIFVFLVIVFWRKMNNRKIDWRIKRPIKPP